AVAAREWALLHPNAVRRHAGPLSHEEVLTSPLVSSPLRQLDCCLVTDGAAAVVLTSADRARDLTETPIAVLGTGSCVTHRGAAHRLETSRAGARRSGSDALGRAGLVPQDIDVLEIYDSFT